MKHKIALALTLCLLASAAGCALDRSPDDASDGTVYHVYYSALSDQQAQAAVDWEERTISRRAVEVSALMQALLAQPETAGLTSPFPDGVRLLSWEIQDGVLHLDLSEQFGGLTGVDLTLADACLALTFCQLDEVEAVYVTVEGHELPYRSVQRLRAEDVALYSGADQPVSIGINLWYPRSDGSGLGVEYRQVTKEKSETLVQAVLAAWASGPQHDSLTACMPSDAQIDSVELEDGVYTVDLSQTSLKGLSPDRARARLTLYSLVNTLGELDQVESVQLLVEGKATTYINGVYTQVPIVPDPSLDPDLDPGTIHTP